VSSGGSHQEEPHRLADPLALPLVEVRDRAEVPVDLGLEPGLLPDLPERGLLGLLVGLDESLRQAPGQLAAPGPPGGQRDVDGAVGAAEVIPPGRALGPGPHYPEPPPPLRWRGVPPEPPRGPFPGGDGERAIRATFAPVAGTRSAPRNLRIAVASPP